MLTLLKNFNIEIKCVSIAKMQKTNPHWHNFGNWNIWSYFFKYNHSKPNPISETGFRKMEIANLYCRALVSVIWHISLIPLQLMLLLSLACHS